MSVLVEDDPLQRMVATDLLSEAGYNVSDAETADAAVKTIEGGWRGRVVVTDMHMSGTINGFQLAQTICERWPALRCVWRVTPPTRRFAR